MIDTVSIVVNNNRFLGKITITLLEINENKIQIRRLKIYIPRGDAFLAFLT